MLLQRREIVVARLDYDMDNFSCKWSRSSRYDIYIGDYIEYHSVSEEEVDRLYDIAMRKAEIWGEKVVTKEIK